MTSLAVIGHLQPGMTTCAKIHRDPDQGTRGRRYRVSDLPVALDALQFAQDHMPAVRVVDMWRQMKQLPEDRRVASLRNLAKFGLLGALGESI